MLLTKIGSSSVEDVGVILVGSCITLWSPYFRVVSKKWWLSEQLRRSRYMSPNNMRSNSVFAQLSRSDSMWLQEIALELGDRWIQTTRNFLLLLEVISTHIDSISLDSRSSIRLAIMLFRTYIRIPPPWSVCRSLRKRLSLENCPDTNRSYI